ncbi:hypothetical protein DCCM_4187 [Desulfocucumis palustris]|uniref:Uncharacterized protein n=1 Tax=Desulfocucumis palustris TaxID=1898651 RepID=A0A2L2XGD8_9FIRM|nr:hypothetical protein [Desulfocucumis palustris]GBF35064.1 hypothetical protein DCCM_4187 [Desulfocucumis palustris]
MVTLQRKRMEDHLFHCGYSRFKLQRMDTRRLISCYNWEMEKQRHKKEQATQQQLAKIRQEFTKIKTPIRCAKAIQSNKIIKP